MDILHNGNLIPDATPTGGPGVTAIDLQDGNGISWAPTRVAGRVALSGGRLAYGTNTNQISTTGTTFATGADLLAAALQFMATGTKSYIVRVFAPAWNNSGANTNNLNLNLDGTNAGIMAGSTAGGIAIPCMGMAFFTPSAGSHSVNVRLTVSAGTGFVYGGAAGAGANFPILITLEVA